MSQSKKTKPESKFNIKPKCECNCSCSAPGVKQTETDDVTGTCSSLATNTHVISNRHSLIPEGAVRLRYRIDNMDCPTEEMMIRNKLESMPGIIRLDFNLLDRELTVYNRLNGTESIVSALNNLGMSPVLLEEGKSAAANPTALNARQKWLLAISGITSVIAEAVAWTTGQDSSLPVVALAVISVLSAGLPTLKKGWIALKNMTLNIHFLMSLAFAGAMILGKWPEVAMVVFLFALAEAIEVLSLERARNAIKLLSALAPETAEVKVGNDWQEKPVSEVPIGSRIRVRTGSRVPLDSIVDSGSAALDQAPITGESLPVDKQCGDTLYAGSIVSDGVVEATVTVAAGESTLARIATAIQQAQSQRAPTQRFVDKFARYYTPAVVIFAVAIAGLGPLLLGGSWGHWFYEALVILVIACPCALVVSTPVTVVSGLAAAAKHGILIKGGTYLEGGRLLNAVAFDKTGTLTQGKPILTETNQFGDIPIEYALLIAASIDEHSTHPVARALVNGWRELQPDTDMLPVENFGVINGHGVKGDINGEQWYLGNHRLVEDLGICSQDLEAQLAILESTGKSAIVLCTESRPVAVFGVSDSVRPESLQALTALKGLHVVPVMLSGDNSTTVKAIADQLGIQDARGNLMPDDKQTAVAEMKTQYGHVGMAGDGINDAPALARADIGFAMGAAGTATAMETADVAIMDDDPRKIAYFIMLSRYTTTILRQNITLALGIKFLFLAMALSGYATLWMAVFADMGASLLVVFNGLRLLGYCSQKEICSNCNSK